MTAGKDLDDLDRHMPNVWAIANPASEITAIKKRGTALAPLGLSPPTTAKKKGEYNCCGIIQVIAAKQNSTNPGKKETNRNSTSKYCGMGSYRKNQHQGVICLLYTSDAADE